MIDDLAIYAAYVVAICTAACVFEPVAYWIIDRLKEFEVSDEE